MRRSREQRAKGIHRDDAIHLAVDPGVNTTEAEHRVKRCVEGVCLDALGRRQAQVAQRCAGQDSVSGSDAVHGGYTPVRLGCLKISAGTVARIDPAGSRIANKHVLERPRLKVAVVLNEVC